MHYKMNRGLRFLRFCSFNRIDKAFSIPPKARILVWICFQVPAKVQSALLVACVRSLEERRRGIPKTNNTSKENKTEQATPNRDKTIHCQRKRRKKHPASNVAADTSPTPLRLRRQHPNNSKQHSALAKMGNEGGARDIESATVFPRILPSC